MKAFYYFTQVIVLLMAITIAVTAHAEHVAVLCPHFVQKQVVIDGSTYTVPDEDDKFYEGELVKYQKNTTVINTDKGLVTLYGCTTIDVQ